jgi:hypothetical protein
MPYLHRGIEGSTVFVNYAVWESVAYTKQAVSDPEFRARLAHYPNGTVNRAAPIQKDRGAGNLRGITQRLFIRQIVVHNLP